jgi:hypothetical protein
VVVRVVIPLGALAAEGRGLPGLPAFDYGPLWGDANGYYAGAREAISAAGSAALPLVVTLLLGAGLLYASHRRRGPPWVLALIAGATVSAAATFVDLEMGPSGATVVGWPLVWALPLAPLRLLDAGLDPDAAFVVGLVLSLLAVAVTVIATAYIGLFATGRRCVGLVAAALFALWPFVPGLLVGSQGWENGMWNVEVGLHLYTEPLSTALVAVAVALLLRPGASDLSIVLSGLALGYATVVKLTDGLIAAGLVIVVLAAGRRRAAAVLTAGGLVFAPLLVVHWHKGYVGIYDGGIGTNEHPFGLQYIVPAWTDSLLFTPLLLAVLVLPAVIGFGALPGSFPRAVIGVPVAVTVATYSLYDVTPLHPRFFYVVLPLVLVLDAGGAVSTLSALRARRLRSAGSVRVL